MNPETAYRLLGVSENATLADLTAAKRALLAHLHPDLHDGQHKQTFERLARDTLEAFEVAKSELDRRRDGKRATEDEFTSHLFDLRAADSWNQARDRKGSGVARFNRRYSSDKQLAVAILGIDPRFEWTTTSLGTQVTQHGSALYIVAWNHTSQRVESLSLTRGLLIDDLAHQYQSFDAGFYWVDANGAFQRHGTMIAPNAKLDGFLLYPPLRAGAQYFARWFLADSFYVMGERVTGEYNVTLPERPQLSARGLLPPANGIDADDGESNGAGDVVDRLGHRWAAGGVCTRCGRSRDAAEAFGWSCAAAVEDHSETSSGSPVPLWSEDLAVKVAVNLLLTRDSSVPDQFATELRATLVPAISRYRHLANERRYEESLAYCEFALRRLDELSD